MTERYFCSPQQQSVGVPAGAFLLLPSLPQFAFHFLLLPFLPPFFYSTFPLLCISFILPASFHTSSFSPSFVSLHIGSRFGSNSPPFLPSFLLFFLFYYSQILIYIQPLYNKEIRYEKHKISTTKTSSASLSSQWIPADFKLTRL